jgi:predicted RNA binding protein YcfA (HicA-like mRNA interferase family)
LSRELLRSIVVGRTLTAREVIRRIEERGGYRVRTKGSHATYEAVRRNEEGEVVEAARAQVPVHRGDVPPGTLRSIQRQLESIFGQGWLI